MNSHQFHIYTLAAITFLATSIASASERRIQVTNTTPRSLYIAVVCSTVSLRGRSHDKLYISGEITEDKYLIYEVAAGATIQVGNPFSFSPLSYDRDLWFSYTYKELIKAMQRGRMSQQATVFYYNIGSSLAPIYLGGRGLRAAAFRDLNKALAESETTREQVIAWAKEPWQTLKPWNYATDQRVSVQTPEAKRTVKAQSSTVAAPTQPRSPKEAFYANVLNKETYPYAEPNVDEVNRVAKQAGL